MNRFETGRIEAMLLHMEGHLQRTESVLVRVVSLLESILALEKKMAGELDALTTQVSANTDAEQSAIVLLKGLKEKLDAAGTDPVKLAALSTALKTSQDALAAAIVENTPAA